MSGFGASQTLRLAKIVHGDGEVVSRQTLVVAAPIICDEPATRAARPALK